MYGRPLPHYFKSRKVFCALVVYVIGPCVTEELTLKDSLYGGSKTEFQVMQ